jgi:hypothetical protein
MHVFIDTEKELALITDGPRKITIGLDFYRVQILEQEEVVSDYTKMYILGDEHFRELSVYDPKVVWVIRGLHGIGKTKTGSL